MYVLNALVLFHVFLPIFSLFKKNDQKQVTYEKTLYLISLTTRVNRNARADTFKVSSNQLETHFISTFLMLSRNASQRPLEEDG